MSKEELEITRIRNLATEGKARMAVVDAMLDRMDINREIKSRKNSKPV